MKDALGDAPENQMADAAGAGSQEPTQVFIADVNARTSVGRTGSRSTDQLGLDCIAQTLVRASRVY